MQLPTTIPNAKLFLHAGGDIGSSLVDTADFLQEAQRAVFLPYAVHDFDAYTARMSTRFDSLGVRLTGLHSHPDPVAAVAEADAIVVGGGNTFRLIKTLHDLRLIEPVRQAVRRGVPYWGASAGSNVACPTIRTTNDMPIVEPPTLRSFGLVSFQINPHYVDEPDDGVVKETREFRINEFLEENDVPVVGLREDSWLIADRASLRLFGEGGAVLFRRELPPENLYKGDDVSYLFDTPVQFDAALSSPPNARVST